MIMLVVNESASSATHQYLKERCTRHCHDKGCPHFQENFSTYQEQLPFADDFRQLYRENIQALKENSLGLNYRQINLLIYVVLFPLISLLLVWGAWRKKMPKSSQA